jgi:hypothetical protein
MRLRRLGVKSRVKQWSPVVNGKCSMKLGGARNPSLTRVHQSVCFRKQIVRLAGRTASSSKAARDVQAVLHRPPYNGVAVAAETGDGVEELDVEGGGGVYVLGLCVQTPVPVAGY